MDTSYSNQNKIYRYGSLIDNEVIPNYKKDREKFFTSIESDINKRLSLLSNKYNKPSLQLNTENIDYNSKQKNISRNLCYCDCHTNNYSLNIPEYQCDYYFYKKPIFMEYKINNSLQYKINDLKNNLHNFENKLNKTKIEKSASDFYIKKLEKDLSHNSKNNTYNPFNYRRENKNKKNDNFINNNKLNKTSILFNDSFLDRKNKIIQKKTIKENNSFNMNNKNKNKDYNIIIQRQKIWLDTIHQNHKNTKNNFYTGIDNYLSNNNNNNNYDYSNNFNYINNYDNNYFINKCKSLTKNNSIPKYNTNNYSYNFNYNYDTNISYNNNNNYNKNSYDYYKRNNTSDYHINSSTNIEKELIQEPNNINTLKSQNINNEVNEYNYKPKSIIYNSRIQSDLINNLIQENDNKKKTYILNNDINKKDNMTFNNNSIKESYLILDNKGNQIYKNGKKIIGMKIKNKVNKKNHFINMETVIITGSDGQPKSLELRPIFLDNNKPLVNEENKPFLGINNFFFIDENENPIVGTNDILNENKQIVQGQLGILPRDKRGNISKISLLNDNTNENKDDYLNKKNKDKSSNKNGKSPIKKLATSVDGKTNIKQKYYPELIKTENNINKMPLKNKKKLQKLNYINIIKNNKCNRYNKYNIRKALSSSCFACDVGCGISRTGYSSMTYSPFNKRQKRNEETLLKNGTKYEQYYKYKN